ncbi:hypothetical protein PO124_20090 [Bacillus licheniformis]|nr:hypothetical protein [Bacillus licheniformis]
MRQVASGSPAEKRALKRTMSSSALTERNRYRKRAAQPSLQLCKIGDTVKVTLIRNGKTMTKQITLDQKESASS